MSNETEDKVDVVNLDEGSPLSESLMQAAINAKPVTKVVPLVRGIGIPVVAGFLFAVPAYLFMQGESFIAIAGAFLALPWFLYSTVAEHHACKAINALALDEAIRTSMMDALMQHADNSELSDKGTSDAE